MGIRVELEQNHLICPLLYLKVLILGKMDLYLVWFLDICHQLLLHIRFLHKSIHHCKYYIPNKYLLIRKYLPHRCKCKLIHMYP